MFAEPNSKQTLRNTQSKMIPEARKDVLSALREAIAAIKEKRVADLHAISDHILHVMVIYQDPDIIDVAIAIYALDKILQTEKYRGHPKMKPFMKTSLHLLQKAKSELETEDYEGYSTTAKDILGNIEGFSKKIRFYVEDILHFARIKKGTKLYEHGLSLGQAAETMGVTKWEIMPVAGETVVHERYVEPIAKDEERLQLLRKRFGVKK